MKKQKIFSKLTVLLLFLFVLVFGLFLLVKVNAGPEHNVSGWAWSENIGWISLNSKNCDLNNNDFIDIVCGGDDSTIKVINYGVKIDSNDGTFSGYAWSENIGWINFAPEGPYPEEPQNAARLINNTVSGWIRAEAHDDSWDGWIKMSGTTTENEPYGVSISNDGKLHGWAWGGNVVGWISFNCAEGGEKSTNICAQSQYAVSTTNTRPNPPDSLLVTPYYCANQVMFSWNFSHPENDTQSAYQIQISTNSTFPEAEIVFKSEKIASNSTSSVLSIDKLKYNTTYFWRVMVWDSKGAASEWSKEENSFLTPLHHYPEPNFGLPSKIMKGIVAKFEDKSQCYTTNDASINCKEYEWNFGPNASPISSTVKGNATTTFSQIKDNKISLRVTDESGYSCSKEQSITVKSPPPSWIEILPHKKISPFKK